MSDAVVRWRMNHKGEAKISPGIPDFLIDDDAVYEAYRFHSALPGYRPTGLHRLKALSDRLGLGEILLKDESTRFGLNAFKGLGGSFAVAKLLSEIMIPGSRILDFEKLRSACFQDGMKGRFTFVTATDGNHGRGVAWAARILGQKAAVFMPKGSSKWRYDAIAAEGADVRITDLNYDDTVRTASSFADEHGFILVQDQAWEGYTVVPSLIMQGYLTIMHETVSEIRALGLEFPTHIFLQAGVGSFAGSMLAYLEHAMGDRMPVSLVMEPHKAATLFESSGTRDGSMAFVGGGLDTIMAGLACGEPNPIAWRILKRSADAFASCADEVAALGMRILGNPLGDDSRIVSGESGAAGAGLIYLIREHGKDDYGALGKAIGLGPSSRLLLISTEGDTDPERYRQITWEGRWPLT